MPRWKRLLTFVMTLLVALAVMPLRAFADYEQIPVSHAIAISYDNSSSMYDSESSWSNAKYSIEVLAAMLGSEDSLRVYAMDQAAEKLSMSGSEPMADRVAKVHATDFGVSNSTDIKPTRTALEYLKGVDADEKILIITTDGQFFSDGFESIDTDEGLIRMTQIAEAAASEDITVIFVAIGSYADAIQEQTDKGIYVKKTGPDTILDTMVEIANQVFGRAILPAKYWNENTGKISFDVPMANIVVLSQGEKSSLGKLTGTNASVNGEIAPVSWSQMPGEMYDGSKPNEKLHGMVGMYDEFLPAGDYQLTLSGSESTAVYYMPYVDIATTLTNLDGTPLRLDPNNMGDITAGDYIPSMQLLDPFTGSELSSPLLDGADCRLEMTQNGNTVEVPVGQTVSIEPGDVTFRAVADVPGGVRVVQQFELVHAQAQLSNLVVDVTGVPAQTNADALDVAENRPTGRVVVSKADGTELTVDEWSLMELGQESADGLTWQITKVEAEPGVFEVTLESITRKYSIFDWIRMHLLPHVTHGIKTDTKFTATVTSTLSNLGGESHAQTMVAGNFYWWIWIIIGIVSALVFRWLTRPKLPRLRPAVDIADGLGYIAIMGAVKRSGKWPSLGPEKAQFDLRTRRRRTNDVRAAIGLNSIGLVAAGSIGERRCVVNSSTAGALKQMVDSHVATTNAIDASGKPQEFVEGDFIRIKRTINGIETVCKIRLFYDQ